MHTLVGKLCFSKYDAWYCLDLVDPKNVVVRKLNAYTPFVVLKSFFYPEDPNGFILQLKILNSEGEIGQLTAYSGTIQEVTK